MGPKITEMSKHSEELKRCFSALVLWGLDVSLFEIPKGLTSINTKAPKLSFTVIQTEFYTIWKK